MAYDKTTWIDNVTPMDAERFNKIEDALKDAYDNSEEDATVISFFQSIGWTASLTMNKIYSLLNFLGHKDTPIGAVQMYAGSSDSVASGWLLCDGSEVSKTTYAKLYAVIGDNYSTGDETEGNFRLPNLVDRVPIGAGNTYPLAQRGGATTSATGNHKLVESEVPKHNHGSKTISYRFRIRKIGSGSDMVFASTNTSVSNYSESGGPASNGSGTYKLHNVDFSASHTHDNFGGNGTHNHGSVSTIQPYVAINYIIYSGVVE